MRAILAIAGLILVVACQPDPAMANLAGPPGRKDPPTTRLIVQRGGERELVSTAAGGPTETPPPPTRIPSTTVGPTGTPTATPTRTATPTTTPPATRRPVATATPRPNPDLIDAVNRFQQIDRLRAHGAGPGLNITQSFDGPDKMHIQMADPEYLEAINVDSRVWVRQGSYWRRLASPPDHLVERADAVVPLLARVRREGLVSRGVQRSRSGRCYEWEVADVRPDELARFCLGVSDNLPYRISWLDGLVIEFYDWDADVTVPDQPFPIKA